MKRLVPAAVLVTTALVLSGCGSAPTPSARSSANSSPSASTGPSFDPCHGLHVSAVSHAFGAPLKLERGSAMARVCGLEPARSKGPRLKFTISYLWFAAGLDQAWKTVKVPKGATVTRPRIARADATRLVAHGGKAFYAVTAFLQTGRLIEEINGVALAPYDAGNVTAATKALMSALAVKAPRG